MPPGRPTTTAACHGPDRPWQDLDAVAVPPARLCRPLAVRSTVPIPLCEVLPRGRSSAAMDCRGDHGLPLARIAAGIAACGRPCFEHSHNRELPGSPRPLSRMGNNASPRARPSAKKTCDSHDGNSLWCPNLCAEPGGPLQKRNPALARKPHQIRFARGAVKNQILIVQKSGT